MAVADAIDSSRALEPKQSGFADVDGVRIAYDVFGEGEQTLLLVPPWAIVHSRFWKAQVPYLARHFRVVTFDARGNGRSDRPDSPEAYGPRATEQDALAVLDAVGVEHCVMVIHCGPAPAGLLLAQSELVAGALFIAPALPLTPPVPERTGHSFDADLPAYEGWARANRHSWERDYRGYLEFFFGRCFTEPHSTKQIEDSIGWGLETDGATLAHTIDAPGLDEANHARAAGEHLVPAAGGPGRRGRARPGRSQRRLRGADRGRAGDLRGRRPLLPRARPGALQPPAARLRRAGLRA
jgi:pimeloyl-ACP methyl ester carboxylesterase